MPTYKVTRTRTETTVVEIDEGWSEHAPAQALTEALGFDNEYNWSEPQMTYTVTR